MSFNVLWTIWEQDFNQNHEETRRKGYAETLKFTRNIYFLMLSEQFQNI
jgi:hypothetical protein